MYLKNVRDVVVVAMTVLGASIFLKATGCLSSNYSATWLQIAIDAMSCIEVLGTLLGGAIVLHLAVYFGTKYRDEQNKKLLDHTLEHKDELGECDKDSGDPLMLAELFSQLTLSELNDCEDKEELFTHPEDLTRLAQLKPGEWFVDSKGRL
ncbi:MAG: hypothetical protein JSS62_03915 [Verrucomicrobia bacterium]|nr:hypothetical protein [Verrucomicrobiota bacterium]MBS0647084.1 hypothetical protein [Verrucomicrobiota bacterium]